MAAVEVETREELDDTPVLETDDDLVLVDEALEVELLRVLEVDARVLDVDRVLELDARVLVLDRMLEVDERVLELERILEVDTLVLVLDRLVVETTVTGLEVEDDDLVEEAMTEDETPSYPSLYTSKRSPAPQYSELLPLQSILHSEIPPGATTAPLLIALPHQHSDAYSIPAIE